MRELAPRQAAHDLSLWRGCAAQTEGVSLDQHDPLQELGIRAPQDIQFQLINRLVDGVHDWQVLVNHCVHQLVKYPVR
jgi:hypothetical protein